MQAGRRGLSGEGRQTFFPAFRPAFEPFSAACHQYPSAAFHDERAHHQPCEAVARPRAVRQHLCHPSRPYFGRDLALQGGDTPSESAALGHSAVLQGRISGRPQGERDRARGDRRCFYRGRSWVYRHALCQRADRRRDPRGLRHDLPDAGRAAHRARGLRRRAGQLDHRILPLYHASEILCAPHRRQPEIRR